MSEHRMISEYSQSGRRITIDQPTSEPNIDDTAGKHRLKNFFKKFSLVIILSIITSVLLFFGSFYALIFVGIPLALAIDFLKRIPSIQLLWFRFVLSIFRFRWLKYRILEHKFGILSHGYIIHGRMVGSIHRQHDLVPLMLKIVATTPALMNQFPSLARQRIEKAYQMQFDLLPLQDFFDYYAGDLTNFAKRLVNGENLSKIEQERLIFETTPQILEFLENILPSAHPILQAIRDQRQINLESDLSLIK